MAHLTEDERWKGVVACSAGKLEKLELHRAN